MKPETRKVPQSVLDSIKAVEAARRTVMDLAIKSDWTTCNQIGDAAEGLTETLAALRKPYQPTPTTFGPLPEETL